MTVEAVRECAVPWGITAWHDAANVRTGIENEAAGRDHAGSIEYSFTIARAPASLHRFDDSGFDLNRSSASSGVALSQAFKSRDGRPHYGRSAFSLKTAVIFAAEIAIVLSVSAALNVWMGERGVVVAATEGGFADTHSLSSTRYFRSLRR